MPAWFNPLGDLAKKLREWYLELIAVFQHWVASPISLDNFKFVSYLYGNALGLVGYLSLAVTFVAVILALISKKGRVTLVQAVLVLFSIGIIGPLWFMAIYQLQSISAGFSNAVMQMSDKLGTSAGSIPPLGSIASVMMAIYFYAITALYVLWLISIFIGYVFVGIGVKFLGLIVFSLLALGERTQKVFSFLVAIGLVSLVLGQPAANFLISLGQWVAQSRMLAATNDIVVTGSITIVSLMLAILVQPLLMFLMYKSVAPITGKIFAAVKGKVETISRDRSSVTAKVVNANNTSALQARTQAVPVRQPTYTDRVKVELRRAAVNKGAALLAAKAAAHSHPAAVAAFKAGEIAVKHLAAKAERRTRELN